METEQRKIEKDAEESKGRYKKSPEYNKILDKDDAFFVHLSAGLTLIRVNSASRRITMIYSVKKYTHASNIKNILQVKTKNLQIFA